MRELKRERDEAKKALSGLREHNNRVEQRLATLYWKIRASSRVSADSLMFSRATSVVMLNAAIDDLADQLNEFDQQDKERKDNEREKEGR